MGRGVSSENRCTDTIDEACFFTHYCHALSTHFIANENWHYSTVGLLRSPWHRIVGNNSWNFFSSLILRRTLQIGLNFTNNNSPEYVKMEWSPLWLVNLIHAHNVNCSSFGNAASYWMVPSFSSAYFSTEHCSLATCKQLITTIIEEGEKKIQMLKSIIFFFFILFLRMQIYWNQGKNTQISMSAIIKNKYNEDMFSNRIVWIVFDVLHFTSII